MINLGKIKQQRYKHLTKTQSLEKPLLLINRSLFFLREEVLNKETGNT